MSVCRETEPQLLPAAHQVEHLQACDNCRSHYDFECAFLEAVHDSGAVVGDFEPLRVRVLAALAAEGMTTP